MDPIKYIFEKPALTGKIAWWQVMLTKYDVVFVTWTAIKGQAIVGHLAKHPVDEYESIKLEFPDKDVMAATEEPEQFRWKMYFDGVANASGNWVGTVLVSPDQKQIPIAVKLNFQCTSNVTEYEACIVGLHAALELRAYEIDVFRDSLPHCVSDERWMASERSKACAVPTLRLSIDLEIPLHHLHVHPENP